MADIPTAEAQRLKVLHDYDIIGSEDEVEFDNLTKLAAHICDAPIATISFIGENTIWSKARFGDFTKEVPREGSFCHHTIQQKEYMAVEDATKDERFSEADFVVSEPNFRFYTGVNISVQGANIGTICVFGKSPKKLSEVQLNALKTLANEVESRLELKKKNKELETTSAFLEASVEMMLIIEPETLMIEKVISNSETPFCQLEQKHAHKTLHELFPDWDYVKKLQNWESSKTEYLFKCESVLTHKDDEIYLELNAIRKHGKLLVTAKDITKRKETENELKRQKVISDNIINSLPIDFYMFDDCQNLILWNENMANSTGYSEDELPGLKPLDFFGKKDTERIANYIEKTKNGYNDTIQADLIRKDGSSVPFLFNATTFKNSGKTFLIGTGQNISQQLDYQKKLEALLTEKEVLLSEVHHRVKNNLAVISGFLQMEEFKSDNEEIKAVLISNYMRVKSMALIHEELYKAENFSGLQFDQYLIKFLQIIEEKLKPAHKDIKLEVKVNSLRVNLNQAVPLALIINELVSNAYEYAFKGRDKGTITVALNSLGEKIHLLIKDDGIGLPDGFVLEESPTLGTTLVTSYSEQINSEINISTENGTAYELTFESQNNHKGSSVNAMFYS